MARKRKRVTKRTKLGIESLEHRLPFAADAISIDLDFGPAQESLLPAEHTIAGIGEIFEVAGASTSDGRHLFLYGTESSFHFQITGRFTSSDGTPGPPASLLVEIPLSTSTSESTVRFAGDVSDNGTLTLVWTVGTDLFAQQFDSNLQPISAAISLDDSNNSSGGIAAEDAEVSVRVDELGQVGIAYTDPITSVPVFEIYSSDLQQRRFDWQASTATSGGDVFDLKLTHVAENGFGLTWLSSTSNSAHDWTGHIARFPDSDSPTETTVPLLGFSDPPEIATTSDGGLVVAGEEEDQHGASQVVVKTLDASFHPLDRYALPPEYSFAHGSGLVIAPNDVVFLGLFDADEAGNHFSVQTLNGDLTPLDSPIRVNQTELATELEGALFPLATGGVAAYWHGLALDGASSAILSRTYRQESVQLDVAIDGIDSTASLSSSYLEILGFNNDIGLDTGFLSNTGSWILPATELGVYGGDGEGTFQMFASTFDNPIELQARLVKADPSGNDETLAAHNYLFGSPDSEVLEPTFSAGTVDGGEGIDTIQIPFGLPELNAVFDDGDLWLNYGNEEGNEETLHIQSVERFRVDDSVWTLPELLSAIADAQAESSDDLSLGSSNDETTSVPPLNQYDNALASSSPVRFAALGMRGRNGDLRAQPLNRALLPVEIQQVRTVSALSPLAAEGESGPRRPADSAMKDRMTAIRGRDANSHSEADGEGEALERNAGLDKPTEFGQIDFSDILDLDQEAESSPRPGAAATADTSVGQLQYRTGTSPQRQDGGQTAHATQGVVVQRQAMSDLTKPPAVSVVPPPTRETRTLSPVATKDIQPTSLPSQTTVFVATNPEPAFEQKAMFAGLDKVEKSIENELNDVEIIVGSAVVLATGISIANIAWTLRSSILLSNLMSSLPVYVAFDPLPLLNQSPSTPWESSSTGADSPDLSLAEIAQRGVGGTSSNRKT